MNKPVGVIVILMWCSTYDKQDFQWVTRKRTTVFQVTYKLKDICHRKSNQCCFRRILKTS